MKMSKQVKRGEMFLLALQNLQQRWTHETFKRGWDCWGEYERELAALIPPEAPFVFEKGTKAPFGFIATIGKTRVHFYLRTVGRRQRELVAEPIK